MYIYIYVYIYIYSFINVLNYLVYYCVSSAFLLCLVCEFILLFYYIFLYFNFDVHKGINSCYNIH